ncbi:MAG: type II toxin-antitoxin system PemK/MazF family toxin [Oscillospiraceae bacterium]|nr:type II toxin-antitoxin system PemK/MazF family toxin [Oscillospiraceae bacterium]
MTFKQGDIVKFNFDPALGHEQAGYRPAVVISREVFNQRTKLIIVCPVTNSKRPYPTRIPLDEKTKTQGFVICEQVATIDINARKPQFIERMSDDVLDRVLAVVSSEISRE